jgi:hypothetical protein
MNRLLHFRDLWCCRMRAELAVYGLRQMSISPGLAKSNLLASLIYALRGGSTYDKAHVDHWLPAKLHLLAFSYLRRLAPRAAPGGQ